MRRQDEAWESHVEERKLECFDLIIDIFQDKELSYQKRASMICDVIREYLWRE